MNVDFINVMRDDETVFALRIEAKPMELRQLALSLVEQFSIIEHETISKTPQYFGPQGWQTDRYRFHALAIGKDDNPNHLYLHLPDELAELLDIGAYRLQFNDFRKHPFRRMRSVVHVDAEVNWTPVAAEEIAQPQAINTSTAAEETTSTKQENTIRNAALAAIGLAAIGTGAWFFTQSSGNNQQTTSAGSNALPVKKALNSTQMQNTLRNPFANHNAEMLVSCTGYAGVSVDNNQLNITRELGLSGNQVINCETQDSNGKISTHGLALQIEPLSINVPTQFGKHTQVDLIVLLKKQYDVSAKAVYCPNLRFHDKLELNHFILNYDATAVDQSMKKPFGEVTCNFVSNDKQFFAHINF